MKSHVRNMLSDGLCSRLKGWSKNGCYRISKLRCYTKNNDHEKIFNLVRYSRKKIADTNRNGLY